jgi:8-oxo-dGTP diphosphatase
MKIVAKLVVIDPDDTYLLMHRSNHPTFGEDPDLPGGTLEDGETPLEAMVREVQEEAGITINTKDVREVYSGTDYSNHDTHYVLFVTNTALRPEITLSWEHSSYEWLPRNEFLEKAKSTEDTFMQMAHDVMSA